MVTDKMKKSYAVLVIIMFIELFACLIIPYMIY
jgi:hypothetical protein